MLPRTTVEQRTGCYEDVERLLSPGFLTLPIQVGDTVLHLRSLCPGDLFLLRARAALGQDTDWHLWTVASALWMIDGVSLLGKDESIPHIRNFLRDRIRPNVLNLLFYQVLGFFARVDRAIEATTAYCYEHTSRYRWRTSQRGGLLFRGVPGGERLGTNVVQSIWLAFNEVEDQRVADENQWELFKFIASTNAPKAVKKIDAGDKQRRQSEEARRQAALDRYYYFYHGVIDASGYRKGAAEDALGARVEGPKSVEELEDEMKRWVSGDQDEHDRIIAAYKDGIRQRQRQAKEEQEQRRLAFQAERDRMEREAPMRGPQPLVGLTAEQLQRVLSERQPGLSTVRWIPEGPAGGEANYIHDNWLAPQESTGVLQLRDGHLVAPGANPEQDVKRLSALVDDRKVLFSGGGGD